QAGHGPGRDWLNIAVTTQAKAKIRSWFKKEKREENIAAGKLSLEKELRRNDITFDDAEYDAYFDELAKKCKLANTEELYAAIGYGGISLTKIVPRIKDDFNKKHAAAKTPKIVPIHESKVVKSSEGVVVEGIDNCLIKLSKCCAPLPGDDIIGFITRGHGVSIHKRDCNNVPHDISKAEEPERWISAYWDGTKSESFTSTIQAMFIDREGIVIDVMNAINNMRVPVHSINARETRDGNCMVTVTVSAESVEHLRSIIARIEKINGAFNVERINN
ncbi:MAG: ACT domain-containing protein, partial [Acutalibacteraceae bacterium]|nr:ACT domain-containing protein [Acutalibacteraceae bacterium]